MGAIMTTLGRAVRVRRSPALGALALALGGPAYAGPAPGATEPGGQPSAPAALRQPAMVTPKALGAAMLAVAGAGPRLVAAGERGIILYSDDGGRTWRQASVPVSVSLTALQFVDASHGWAVGHQGVVLHSSDGGQHWSKQLDGMRAAALVLQAAEAAAGAQPGPDQARAVDDARRLVEDGPDKPFLDLYFDSPRSGYVLGAYNLLFKTTDGGATWQPWHGHVANPKGLHLYGMRGAAGALYLAGEQGLLLRSTDGGASFAAVPTPYKGSYFGVMATRGGALLAYGLRGNAYWSADRGATWSKVDTGIQASLAGGAELADGTLALVSQGGDVLLSRDQGRSFVPLAAAGPAQEPPLNPAAQGQPGVQQTASPSASPPSAPALPPGLPLAAVAQAGDGALVLAGLRGVLRVATPALRPAIPATLTWSHP
jgi:photosystem II stability/assembly factor-like uncharacterized protein